MPGLRYEKGAAIAADAVYSGGVRMAEVLLSRHAQVLPPGVAAFADGLRRARGTTRAGGATFLPV